ncbi:hypothetical protein [Pantoea sp.]|uniref:hypothetical protein n=1 Tax=Pantoea sp. TaxID=69393 RepID=UPI00289BEA3A|nr:hypothetical protein [Pantoea sp.]
MTSTLLLTLAAFALLALIIALLVRTTRLRLWQGLILLLMPLLLANLLWFSWLKPQQQRTAVAAQAEKSLNDTPGYRILKTQEPALWRLLQQELAHRLREGEKPPVALGEMRGMLADVVNQRLVRASDASVVHYIAVSVREMQALQRQDPQLCFRFLFPHVSGGVNLASQLSPQLNLQDADAMEQLLLDSTGAERTVDMAEARRTLQLLVAPLYAKWGDKLKQLNMPADAAPDRAAMCAMSIDLYSAILALPEAQAANLLRKMMTLSG